METSSPFFQSPPEEDVFHGLSDTMSDSQTDNSSTPVLLNMPKRVPGPVTASVNSDSDGDMEDMRLLKDEDAIRRYVKSYSHI